MDIIADLLVPLESKTANEWMDIRKRSKGSSRILRQFVNLPLGTRRLATIDGYVVERKQNEAIVSNLQSLLKELSAPRVFDSFSTPEKAVASVDAFFARYRKLRKDFATIEAFSDGSIKKEHADMDKKANDAFASACADLGAHYATILHQAFRNFLQAFEAEVERRKTLQAGAAEVSPLALMKALGDCEAAVPDASVLKIESCSSAECARSWTQSRRVQKMFFAALRSALQLLCPVLSTNASPTGTQTEELEKFSGDLMETIHLIVTRITSVDDIISHVCSVAGGGSKVDRLVSQSGVNCLKDWASHVVKETVRTQLTAILQDRDVKSLYAGFEKFWQGGEEWKGVATFLDDFPKVWKGLPIVGGASHIAFEWSDPV